MANGPTLIRYKYGDATYFTKPGLHSHNQTRKLQPSRKAVPVTVRVAQIFLLIIGLAAIGYYGYSVANEYFYQAYENWAFDQQIAGRRGVTFTDYLKEQTPLGFLARASQATASDESHSATPSRRVITVPSKIPYPETGSVLGRVDIPRLNLSAIVREGVDPTTLKTAVGHVPATALPGQVGNFAIAAHRDTLFRALKDIKKDDVVTFQSSEGTYKYEVISTKIVKPSDVSVLQVDGDQKLLTMITCYPFYYVGSAPERFIVQARLVSQPEAPSPVPSPINETAVAAAAAASAPNNAAAPAPIAAANEAKATNIQPRHIHASSHVRASRAKAAKSSGTQSKRQNKKRNLWHRIIHHG